MSNCYGFDELVELVFSDSLCVKGLRAFINGAPVPVHEYRYPAAATMKTFYIELTAEVRPGTVNRLRIEVDWDQTHPRKKFDAPESKEGAQVIGADA